MAKKQKYHYRIQRTFGDRYIVQYKKLTMGDTDGCLNYTWIELTNKPVLTITEAQAIVKIHATQQKEERGFPLFHSFYDINGEMVHG